VRYDRPAGKMASGLSVRSSRTTSSWWVRHIALVSASKPSTYTRLNRSDFVCEKRRYFQLQARAPVFSILCRRASATSNTTVFPPIWSARLARCCPAQLKQCFAIWPKRGKTYTCKRTPLGIGYPRDTAGTVAIPRSKKAIGSPRKNHVDHGIGRLIGNSFAGKGSWSSSIRESGGSRKSLREPVPVSGSRLWSPSAARVMMYMPQCAIPNPRRNSLPSVPRKNHPL
jgi:hypothetical protein